MITGVVRSLQAWIGYLLLIGVWLLLSPNSLLGVFQIAETSEAWVRVVGMLALVLLILYAFVIKSQLPLMYQATVYARAFAVVILLVLALTTGPWQLALFAAVDAVGATWTYMAGRA